MAKKEEQKETGEGTEAKADFSGYLSKVRANPWIAATIFLAVVLVVFILFKGNGSTGNVVSSDIAAEKLLSFIEAQGQSAEIVSSEADGGLYKVIINYNGQEMPVLVTMDGGYIVTSAIPLNATASNAGTEVQDEEEQAPAEVPKSDKPNVELFVMTYCPYGTQAEKGLIPAIKALGSKIDAKIRFVHYFMHGDEEENETYNQVCIREEQPTKYISYLECFLEDSDSETCLTKAGIDKTKLNSCLAGKAKEYYAEDSVLSNQYGVQGSPTLVINGVQSGAGRSPSSYLAGICAAFNNAPSTECSKTLSSATPSAGFGYAASDSGTTGSASCA